MPYTATEQPRGLLLTFRDPVGVDDLVAAARRSVEHFRAQSAQFGIWDFTGVRGFDPSIEELHELARVQQTAPQNGRRYRHALVGAPERLELLRDDYVLVLEFLTGAGPKAQPRIEVYATVEEAQTAVGGPGGPGGAPCGSEGL